MLAALNDPNYEAPEWLVRSCSRSIVIYVCCGLSDPDDNGFYSLQYIHRLPLIERHKLLVLGIERLEKLVGKYEVPADNQHHLDKAFKWMEDYVANIEEYWQSGKAIPGRAAGPPTQ